MNGADEYAKLFTTGQYGKLYIISGSHARGRTFHIYVLPEGVVAKPNANNAPLNSDAVEVYGVKGGHRGWTEFYGWLYEGKWQEDFYKLVDQKKREAEEFLIKHAEARQKQVEEEKKRDINLLSKY